MSKTTTAPETVRMYLGDEIKDVPLDELTPHMAAGWNQVRAAKAQAAAAPDPAGDRPAGEDRGGGERTEEVNG